MVGQLEAARRYCGSATDELAAETFKSGANWRARPDRIRPRSDVRLRADARDWVANLKPLEDTAVQRLTNWLPKLSNPVRIGEHDQTAFGLGLMFDYGRTMNKEAFAKLVR